MTKQNRIHIINRRVEQSYKRHNRKRQAIFYPDSIFYGHTRNHHPREVSMRKYYEKHGEGKIK